LQWCFPKSGQPSVRSFAVLSSAISVIAIGADWRVFLGTGLDRATTFVALLASLGLLRDAAPDIARGPPCRQLAHPAIPELAIPRRSRSEGSGFGIALNMGAVTLLGTLIKRSNTLAAAGGDPEVVAIREERMNAWPCFRASSRCSSGPPWRSRLPSRCR
jgi:hypothetical protein